MGAGATPAGWYPDPEQPSLERYWTGWSWSDDRRPSTQAPPAPFGAAPEFAQPAAPAGYAPFGGTAVQYPSNAMAGWGLGLSILGLITICCLVGVVFSIAGMIMGWAHMKSVDRGERNPGSRGLGQAAFIVGLIGVVLALGILAYVVVVGVAL